MSNILPVITLYQPWATWIMRGWKPIETRTHRRFACLKGKKILIHAAIKTDANATEAYYHGYLTKEQLMQDPEDMINGYILGSAFVWDFRKLTTSDAPDALIECFTPRYGLFLKDVIKFDKPIRESGEVCIWYFDLDIMQKVKKPVYKNAPPTLF